jgi:hypothetical protein
LLSIRNSTSKLSDDDFVSMVNNYWQAIGDEIPSAFKSPADFQVQRTVGTFAFHLLLASDVYSELKGDTSKGAFSSYLKKIDKEYLSDGFWKTGGPARGYVGSSGRRLLRDAMRDSVKS